VGSSVAAHVRKTQYQTATELYRKRRNLNTLDNSLAYEVVQDDLKRHRDAYSKLTKGLDPEAMGDIKEAGERAMVAAQRSRLPGMHVAALYKPGLVRGYMETVVGFTGTVPEKEIAAALELSCDGVSLFHHAMIKGSAEVVEACVSVILDSGLSLKAKISLLEARRSSDKLGAFYLAMCCGLQDTALAFVKGVLSNTQIDDATKRLLLQCAKPAIAKKAGPDTPASRALKEAARTARAEAEHMKQGRLVGDFDVQVERSGLAHQMKQELQTS
jgi:hypothetical protein